MPYREHPDAVFNPEIHEHVKPHKKTKGGETWVRKTAVESDKQAEKSAELRNMVKEPDWVEKLFKFGDGRKDTAADVLMEEGLEEELKNFKSTNNGWTVGVINGHVVEIGALHFDNTNGAVTMRIDGEIIGWLDTKKICKKIFPLLKQRRINSEITENLKQRLKTKRSVLEVLGKVPNQNLLKESPETKQLPPHTESEENDEEK